MYRTPNTTRSPSTRTTAAPRRRQTWPRSARSSTARPRTSWRAPSGPRRAHRGTGIHVVDELSAVAVDGVPVFVAPDLAFRPRGGAWVVVDWKSGGLGGSLAQVALYTLGLVEDLGAAACPLPVDARVVSLDRGRVVTAPVTSAEVDEARARVAASVDAMRAVLVDPARNVPPPPAGFALAADPRGCPWCPFYELCRPELVRTGAEGAAGGTRCAGS